MARDFQKSKVYAWERKVVGSWDTSPYMSVAEIEDLVSFVWAGEGFNHPPKVVEPRDNKRCATGGRLEVQFPAGMRKRWVVLHELSHSISRIGGEEICDGHGPKFVKIYTKLLVKYLYMDQLILNYTLNEAEIKVA